MADAGGPAVEPTQGEALLQASSDDDELVEFQQSREAAVLAGHEDIWEAATPPDSDLSGNDSVVEHGLRVNTISLYLALLV